MDKVRRKPKPCKEWCGYKLRPSKVYLAQNPLSASHSKVCRQWNRVRCIAEVHSRNGGTPTRGVPTYTDAGVEEYFILVQAHQSKYSTAPRAVTVYGQNLVTRKITATFGGGILQPANQHVETRRADFSEKNNTIKRFTSAVRQRILPHIKTMTAHSRPFTFTFSSQEPT